MALLAQKRTAMSDSPEQRARKKIDAMLMAAEQSPGPGQVAPTHRGPDRQGAVVQPLRRREGRRL